MAGTALAAALALAAPAAADSPGVIPPIVDECPPGQAGTVVNVPFGPTISFCEGP